MTYYEAHREELLAYAKAYYEAHREERLAYAKRQNKRRHTAAVLSRAIRLQIKDFSKSLIVKKPRLTPEQIMDRKRERKFEALPDVRELALIFCDNFKALKTDSERYDFAEELVNDVRYRDDVCRRAVGHPSVEDWVSLYILP